MVSTSNGTGIYHRESEGVSHRSSSPRSFQAQRDREAGIVTPSDIDVVYIASNGRSGSTLLLRLLGTPERHVAIGELHDIWKDNWRTGETTCSCGKALQECEFWNAVMQEAFGEFSENDAQHVLSLRRSTLGARYLPFLAFPNLRPKYYQRRLEEYAAILGATYRAIQEVSGCDVIVDSSKRPTTAMALMEIPGIRPKMIHLVRDSRGCVYSWRKRGRRNAIFFAKRWAFNQLFSSFASRRFDTYCAYRYEDFAANPRGVLADMAGSLGFSEDTVFPFVSDTDVILREGHVVSGNLNRFSQGEIAIRPDLEWKDRMPTREKLIVAFLTLPWLLKYRYVLSSRS